MKNLFLGAILLFSVMTFGQKRHVGATASTQAETSTDTTATPKVKWSKYVAVGLSISSGNSYENNSNTTTFDEASYPSVEFGFSRENISLGAVIGRGNLRGLGTNEDKFSNYYWEVKVVPSFPLGVVNASLIFGAGSYFSNDKGNTFIEYGSGISYTVNKFTYGVCYTNWDGVDYITPNISYSLD
jgi:hypothetical protein